MIGYIVVLSTYLPWTPRVLREPAACCPQSSPGRIASTEKEEDREALKIHFE